jgi:hypothetical protein
VALSQKKGDLFGFSRLIAAEPSNGKNAVMVNISSAESSAAGTF